MTSVFYKTSTDGWRVGVAESFPNTATVSVVDTATRLKETVRADDVYMPKDTDAALLNMAADAQFVNKDDVVAMHPSPVELPPLIECLRHRFRANNPTLFLGDNVALSMAPSEEGDEGVARRVVTTHAATAEPQTVVVNGDASTVQCTTIAASISRKLGADDTYIDKLRAAHLVMASFTHTIDGQQCALRRVDISANSEGLKYAQLQYTLFDYEAVAAGHDFNFVAIGFLIYAFNNEEKERCLIPKRQTEFAAQRTITDMDIVSQLREKYFKFNKAMELLGFEIEVQLTVFARVAAVLHLMDVTFTEEGELQNMNALKNAARLIQTDFNAFTKVITSKEACHTVAKLLYLSIFKYLTRRVNSALNPEGYVCDPAVTVLGVPSPRRSDIAPLGIQNVVLHTLIEDIHQCFYRSSEQEMVQWQREGFAVSEELQSVFDGVDNYSLLRVLKGKGGIISSSLLRDPAQAVEQLNRVSRHPKCNFDPSLGILTVEHSFDTVRYQLPVDPPTLAAVDTVYHERFAAIRDFLIGSTDVDTQEALCLVEQADDREDHHVAHDWQELQTTLALLSDDVQNGRFWWVKVLDTTAGFNGQHIADKLRSQMVHPVVELRSRLPHRYLACDPEYIAALFSTTLPREHHSKPAREKSEIIAKEAGVHHCLGRDSILIEASGIIDLEHHGDRCRDKAAALLQGAAKSIVASLGVRERVEAWGRALSAHDQEQADAQALHKWRVENALRHRDERLELQERENEARVAVRDECWVAWVALQTEVQQHLEDIIQTNVARSINEETRLIKKSIEHCHKAALNEISSRIQDRLLQQGQHLDAVVDMQTKQDQSSVRRVQKLETVNNKLLRSRVAQEEARMELENRLLAKQSRQKVVASKREQTREKLRQEMWIKQERDHAARVRMEKTRDVISNRMRENIIMDDIERTLAKRLKDEVVERQKREKVEREREMRQKRDVREQQLIAQQKQHARAMLRREAAIKKEEEREKVKKRREEMAIWASQEREREAAERLKKEEEKRNKVLTRSLLKAHNLLNSPAVYEQSLRGTSVLSQDPRAKRIDPSVSQGFTMSNEKVTYPRLLNTETWEGIVTYHKSRREGTLETNMASASQGRERSASPRSVFSL